MAFLGAMDTVEDELPPKNGKPTLACHADMLLALFIDEVDVVTALILADVDVFAQLDVAFFTEDDGVAIAPRAEAGGGEPVDANEI